MAPRKTHIHDYIPTRRINKILICRCRCSATQTNLIANFSSDRAKEIDNLIAKLKEATA